MGICILAQREKMKLQQQRQQQRQQNLNQVEGGKMAVDGVSPLSASPIKNAQSPSNNDTNPSPAGGPKGPLSNEQLQQYLASIQGQQSMFPNVPGVPANVAAILQNTSTLQPMNAMNSAPGPPPPPQQQQVSGPSSFLQPQMNHLNTRNMQNKLLSPNSLLNASHSPIAPNNVSSPRDSENAEHSQSPNNPQEVEGATATGSETPGNGTKDGDLNPNAIEFTPQVASRSSNSGTVGVQQNQAPNVPAPATMLATQPTAQYSFNPATVCIDILYLCLVSVDSYNYSYNYTV